MGGAVRSPWNRHRRCCIQKASVRNRGKKMPQVCAVWPTGTTNTIFPSVEQWQRAELKSSGWRFLWSGASPNVQSRLWGARRWVLMQQCTRLGDYLSTPSAPQNLQSAFRQSSALIITLHPFCSACLSFTKANTSQDCAKALCCAMCFRPCSSIAQICSWAHTYWGHFQSVQKGGSCLHRFPRMNVG